MKRAAEDEGGDAEGAEETMDVGGAIESSPASESVTVRMWMTNSAAVSRATPHRPLFGGCSLLRPGARISDSPRL